jgi:HSP20 family protein
MYASMLSVPGGVCSDFERLRREFDDLFGGWPGPASIRSVAPGSFPAVNVGHTPTSIEIFAFAPGLDPAAVEVNVDRGVLTISGERAAVAPEGERATVYTRERFAGSFRRAISLPEDADPARIEASYRDGVLRVSIARRESTQPRRITVQ